MGDNRGTVEVWDRGTYGGTEITDEFVVDWVGEKYKGTAYLLTAKDGGYLFALSSHSPGAKPSGVVKQDEVNRDFPTQADSVE